MVGQAARGALSLFGLAQSFSRAVGVRSVGVLAVGSQLRSQPSPRGARSMPACTHVHCHMAFALRVLGIRSPLGGHDAVPLWRVQPAVAPWGAPYSAVPFPR